MRVHHIDLKYNYLGIPQNAALFVMKYKLITFLLFVLTGCTDENKELAKAGLLKYCQYELTESFKVPLYTTQLPADDPKLTKYEMASIIMSEVDYEKALLEIQNNCCFHERKHPTNMQFRIFVNENPSVAKTSCMFDVYNKGIVYIQRRWDDV